MTCKRRAAGYVFGRQAGSLVANQSQLTLHENLNGASRWGFLFALIPLIVWRKQSTPRV
jgi:hypothetical protein